jgi:hypothetical protein
MKIGLNTDSLGGLSLDAMLDVAANLQLARDIAALSGERRVHYTRPRRHDEIIGQTGEDTRHLIRVNEIGVNEQVASPVRCVIHEDVLLLLVTPRMFPSQPQRFV